MSAPKLTRCEHLRYDESHQEWQDGTSMQYLISHRQCKSCRVSYGAITQTKRYKSEAEMLITQPEVLVNLKPPEKKPEVPFDFDGPTKEAEVDPNLEPTGPLTEFEAFHEMPGLARTQSGPEI